MRIFLSLVFCLGIVSSFAQDSNDSLYKEKYRPQFHFSPAKNWTNDPNGLVYLNGEYHIFYQYNPFGDVWGHMSWGHAVSKDLISWKQLPVAIPEEGNTMIFSGSCVVDKNNTTGFATKPGQIPLVAIYTGHISLIQRIATAHCKINISLIALTMAEHGKNMRAIPVLDLNRRDFRDPKVLWYEKDKKWVMSVVFPQEHIVSILFVARFKTVDTFKRFGSGRRYKWYMGMF
jgi:sucrose-6-phosphate hydrolase SacC (GH32 family)